MRRLGSALLASVLVIASCGDDDDDAASETTSGAAATSAPASTVAATTTAAAAPTTAAAPTATPAGSTAAPTPSSDEPVDPTAQAALLTAEDLPGWTVVPGSDDEDEDVEFDVPECADIRGLDTDPELQREASVNLVSPDGSTRVTHSVVVSTPEAIERAFGVVSSPTMTECLRAALTDALSRPGELPQGVTLTSVEVEAQPLQAGDEAASFAAVVTVTGPATEGDAVLAVRFDAIRVGSAAGLLISLTLPGADPPDPTELATAAADRMAAAAA